MYLFGVTGYMYVIVCLFLLKSSVLGYSNQFNKMGKSVCLYCVNLSKRIQLQGNCNFKKMSSVYFGKTKLFSRFLGGETDINKLIPVFTYNKNSNTCLFGWNFQKC